MAELPPPPVPVDADLRHFPNMPLEVARLRDSGIAGVVNAEIFRCAVLLWCAGWAQVPAGSLPDDDEELCRLVGLGRDLRSWKKIKAGALRGWALFADGRLYHRVVCEKVIEALNSTRLYEWNKACARVRKENFKRSKAKLDRVANPDRPTPLRLEWPGGELTVTEREPAGAVRVLECEFPPERKGMDILPRGVSDGRPTVEGSTPRLVAAREGREGPTHDAVRALIEGATDALRVRA